MRSQRDRDRLNLLTEQIVDAGFEVHRELGPGLLETIYEDCIAIELDSRGIPFERQKPVPVVYKGKLASTPFRLDLIVGAEIILELKSVDKILSVHQAQLLTYLKLTGCPVGLILNFNSALFKEGIKRMVNHFDD